jgi:acetylornithine deacetylase/succinyl-diaminopimelate desuccinylase-like protein
MAVKLPRWEGNMIWNPGRRMRHHTSAATRVRLLLVLLVGSIMFQTPVAYLDGQQAEQAGASEPFGLITPQVVQPIVVNLSGDAFEGRGAGYAGEKKAAEFIAGEFKRIGLKPAGDREHQNYFQEFKFNPRHPAIPLEVLTSRNVLGFIEGEDPVLKQEVIVVGAHYDGQGRTGQADPLRLPPLDTKDKTDLIWNSANDNTTGVSAVLAVAWAIKQGRLHPKRSILFAAFGCEEHGMSGSIEYVTHPTFDLKRHVAMINFEKLGRVPDRPLIAGSTGTSPAWGELLQKASSLTGTQVKTPIPFVIPDSDHYPFAASGIPAVILYVTGPDEAHRPNDIAEKIDFARVAEYARYGLAVLLELANRPARMAYVDALGFDPGLVAHLASDAEAEQAGLKPPDSALKVTGIIPGGAADRAGLKAGDLILKVAGIVFRRDMTLPELQKMQMETVSGQRGMQLPTAILRGGKQLDLTIDLRRPSK